MPFNRSIIERTLAFSLALGLASIPALADEENSATAGGGGDLRSALQNPISSLISLPFKLTFDSGADNGDGTILNINPVIPVTVGDWNLVNRALIPLADVDGAITGPGNPSPEPGSGASGLGDINYSLYFSPVKYDKVIWGVGPSINLPSASDDQLGSDKWSAGITGVSLTVPSWGSTGILGRQLWSFAGDSDRERLNQILIEPFLNYNLDSGWFLLTDIVITANWETSSSNRWTVPLGGGSAECSRSVIKGSIPVWRRTTTSKSRTVRRTGISSSPGSFYSPSRGRAGRGMQIHLVTEMASNESTTGKALYKAM
jgi:hypothetical protein